VTAMNEIRTNCQYPVVLVTDIDGTFVGESAEPNHDVLVAAQAIVQTGAQLIFATGRRPSSARAILGDLLHTAALVSLDGAIGHLREYRLSYIEAFPPRAWSELAVLVGELEWSSARLIVGNPLDRVVTSTWWRNRPMPVPQGRIGLAEFFGGSDVVPISRIELRRSTKTSDTIRSLAVERWNAECNVRNDWWLLLPEGTNKKSGVRRLLDWKGSPPQVVAVGDGRNDLCLLRSADIAVTVEGSVAAAALPHARRIRPPDEGGWSELPRLLENVFRWMISLCLAS
jgi:hydroxymethylpyrimidine pyrophosphatase-like HAD family hydrolase